MIIDSIRLGLYGPTPGLDSLTVKAFEIITVKAFEIMGTFTACVRPRRAMGFAILLASFLPALTLGATMRDPDDYFFQQSFGDLPEELKTARHEGKIGIFVALDNDECPWCRHMKETVLNQTRVQDYYRKHFRILRVDTEGDGAVTDFSGEQMTERALAQRYNPIGATPVYLFFDLSGKLLLRFPGITRDADEFMWLAEFVIEGSYKNKTFTVYKRQKRAAATN